MNPEKIKCIAWGLVRVAYDLTNPKATKIDKIDIESLQAEYDDVIKDIERDLTALNERNARLIEVLEMLYNGDVI